MCNGNIFKYCCIMSKLGSQWCYDSLEKLKFYINIVEARLKFLFIASFHNRFPGDTAQCIL